MLRRFPQVALALSIAACTQPPPPNPPPQPPPIDPAHPTRNLPADALRPAGATSFLSADGQNGDASNRGDDLGGAEPPAADADDEGADNRTVEEGDIYRVLGQGLIANVNAYRGLQLIDASDPAAPKIVGRLQIAGAPVELYAHEGIAYVLMNDWYGYYGSRFAPSVAVESGGIVAAIDISDPAHPVLVDQAHVPGYIQKSRLTKGSDGAALYVAGSAYDYYEDVDGTWHYETRSVVRSFDVTGHALVEAGALDLGGYVTDIAATTEALLVARYDWNDGTNRSRIALVDIADPHGAIELGDEITVAGYVESQFNMDLRGGVLRVVSGSTWSGAQTNHVETFDASDLHTVVALDSATFGDGEQLFATVFLDDRAFFVTYMQVDPFHAFSIDADGTLTERSEFVVSGWNDFFRPVAGDTRLIGIGANDEAGRAMSVSLYDVTDLAATNPLVARADVEVDWSWSEASWDHRAFSVVEDAVNVQSPGGVAETGLVLLPYQGWDDEGQTYTTAVQIFTFSPTTLTKRATMKHGTPVRRSFLAQDALTANLSDTELSLFATSNPDAPEAKGRVELAPDYVDVLPLADGYRARVKSTSSDYWYWWGQNAELPDNAIEILAPGANPDTAAPVATIAAPAQSQVYQSGDALVVVATHVVDWNVYPYVTESDVDVYDVSVPGVPALARSFTTDRIPFSYGGYWGWGMLDCWDCGGWGYFPSNDVHAIPGGLSFLSRHPMQESLGMVEQCNTYVANGQYACVANDEGGQTCTYVSGGIYCQTPESTGETTCSGGFQQCTDTYTATTSSYDCTPLDGDDLQLETSCYDYEQFRYWTRFTLDVLDLRALADASFAAPLELPVEDEGVSALVAGDDVWVSFRRPVDVPGSGLAFVRYYARPVDVSNPASPQAGDAINVPGELIEVEGDTAYTRDWVWGDQMIEVSLNRVQLDLDDGTATLLASTTFEDRYVYDVKRDGAGHLLVNHRAAWYDQDDPYNHLSVIDGATLDELSDVAVDSWATLKDGAAGRALFQVPGGLLVMNLDDATAPYPQAFFALRGWPTRILVDGDAAVVPAGRFGVYEVDLDAFNLLEEP